VNNLTLLVYTNSKVKDVLTIFLKQLEKYFYQIKNILFLSDEYIENQNTCLYTDDEPYYKHLISALEKITTQYVLYCQEDYILYDNVDINEINNAINILNNEQNIGFIRLIQTGIEHSADFNNKYIILNSNHPYYFSTQATIWRKQVLYDLFQSSKTSSIRHEMNNSSFLNKLNCIGLCTKLQGKQTGGHFNSLIFPYIATALVQGKWNFSEYRDVLPDILTSYNVDPNIRGIR